MPIQTALDSISQNQGSPFGFKNRIINGGMVIDQRNVGASVTPAAGADTFIVDRFSVYSTQSSKTTAQQNQGSVTPPTGFTNYIGITSSSAYSVTSSDLFGLFQNVEGYNVADFGWGTLNAQTVTLSFWVRSSLTGTFGGAISNSAQDRSYPFSYTINSANTWEYKTITVPGDTTGTWLKTNGRGMTICWSLGMGSTRSGTAGAWAGTTYFSTTGAVSLVGTNAATFYITGVQLEFGRQASSFDWRPHGTELALCQRYFISYGGTTGYERFAVGLCNNTTGSSASTFLPVQMRAQPTLGYSAVGHFGVYDGGNVYTVTGIAFDQQTNLVANMQFTVASGLTTNRPAQIVGNNTTSARLTFNAEL